MLFGQGDTLALADVQVVEAVRTTTLAARRLMGDTWYGPVSHPHAVAWLVVGIGRFQVGAVGCQCVPPVVRVRWWLVTPTLVVLDDGFSNAVPSLERLGPVVTLSRAEAQRDRSAP
jgi:hypothetical protein